MRQEREKHFQKEEAERMERKKVGDGTQLNSDGPNVAPPC